MGSRWVLGNSVFGSINLPRLNPLQKVGNTIKSGVQKAGSAIKKGFQKVGGAIKAGAQKVKQGLQTAGKFIKTYGPTIAKIGLKTASTIGSVASRVVNFVPVIGKPASKILKVATKGLNMASNVIPANLPSSLRKTSEIMDDIQDPFGESFVWPMVSWRLTLTI